MRVGFNSVGKLLVVLGYAALSACKEQPPVAPEGFVSATPNPRDTHYLSVGQGDYFGFVTSSPVGIDYGPPSISNSMGPNISAAYFPADSNVQLCASPPPQPAGSYDIAWTGSCSGTAQCTTVRMDSDKSCNLSFSPVRPALPDLKEKS